jgi:integrase
VQEGAKLPENNQRTRHLSFAEEDRLFAELTGEREYLRSLVTVAIYAGPRRGELLKLRWADVDFDLNTINFKQTKTNRDRAVPMEPIVRAALLSLRETSGMRSTFLSILTPERGMPMLRNLFPQHAARQVSLISGFTIYVIRSVLV